MKKFYQLLLVLLCFVVSISLFTPSKAEAGTTAKVEIASEKSDLFIVVRTHENGRNYISFYTDSGEFIMKVEEL